MTPEWLQIKWLYIFQFTFILLLPFFSWQSCGLRLQGQFWFCYAKIGNLRYGVVPLDPVMKKSLALCEIVLVVHNPTFYHCAVSAWSLLVFFYFADFFFCVLELCTLHKHILYFKTACRFHLEFYLKLSLRIWSKPQKIIILKNHLILLQQKNFSTLDFCICQVTLLWPKTSVQDTVHVDRTGGENCMRMACSILPE